MPKYSAAAETDRRELLVGDRSPDPRRHRSTFAPRIGKEVLVDGQGAGAQQPRSRMQEELVSETSTPPFHYRNAWQWSLHQPRFATANGELLGIRGVPWTASGRYARRGSTRIDLLELAPDLAGLVRLAQMAPGPTKGTRATVAPGGFVCMQMFQLWKPKGFLPKSS